MTPPSRSPQPPTAEEPAAPPALSPERATVENALELIQNFRIRKRIAAEFKRRAEEAAAPSTSAPARIKPRIAGEDSAPCENEVREHMPPAQLAIYNRKRAADFYTVAGWGRLPRPLVSCIP